MKTFLCSVLTVGGVLLCAGCADPVGAEQSVPPPVRKQFFVGDFGISPDSENIYEPLKALLSQAMASPTGAEILFEPNAVYRIALPDGKGMQGKYAVHIKGATNLVFNGQGATLLITHPEIGGICTEDSTGIEVKKFRIDYDPLPYAQGRIHAVNLAESWFELKVDEGFPEPDQVCFDRAMSKWGLTIRDTADGGMQYGPAALFSKHWKKTGDRIWRFQTTENGYDASLQRAGLNVGERYIHMARNYAQAIAAKRCDQILWENITIYSSPGLAFYPHSTAHHTIRDCHVKVKEGRIFSTDADGIHMRGSRGNALIEGCSFEGMADDGINVHSSAMSVLAQPAPNQVIVKKHTYTVRVGDRLEAVRSAAAEILGQATVTTVEDQGRGWLLTLDRNFEGLADSGGTDVNAHGDAIVSTVFYNLSEAANPVTIRNCTFNDYRGRGVLISARGATVEDNSFNVREGWGVVLNYESSRWAEGPIAQDAVIRNNRFVAKEQSRQPAIISEVHTRGGAVVEGMPVKNIRIEGNLFDGWQQPIRMQHAENIVTKNNEIIGEVFE